jgi:hypothetical protein
MSRWTADRWVGRLFRRLEMLHIDWAVLAEEDPLLFREIQGYCTLCESRRRCLMNLANELADPGWEDWQDYCPNARTLSVLATLQGCRSVE